MTFDSLTMAAVSDEVRETVGARIQRILQPSATSVGIAVYAGHEQRWLLLSADAHYARVHFSTERLAKAFATPSPFVMLLRKYLDGGRVVAVEQVSHERILRLSCQSGAHLTILIVEVMGKHSNIMLTDEAGTILGAVKSVPPRQSRVRPIMPGLTYVPPPPRERDRRLFRPGPLIDPIAHAAEFQNLLGTCPPDSSARQALLGLLPGCGPFLVNQILARAGFPESVIVGDADVKSIMGSVRHFYGLQGTGAWEPCTFIDARQRKDFAPYVPAGVGQLEKTGSMSDAIDVCLSDNESRDALSAARKSIVTEIERAHRAAEGKVASLQKGLEATREADTVREQGQLMLAYQHAFESGSDHLSIPDLHMTIPLDPALSAHDNAEKTFRRYKKLRDAGRRIPDLLVGAESDASRLADLAVFARLADSEAALRAVRGEIETEPKGAGGIRKKVEKRRGPARFRLDGHVAIAGRNARENEEVTFQLGQRDDLWLHARERTGAHVVLQVRGELPDHVLEAAAALAAYFSEGRADTYVDVDIARVRDIRKIPGGPPGRVTYRNARSVRVRPGIDAWERL